GGGGGVGVRERSMGGVEGREGGRTAGELVDAQWAARAERVAALRGLSLRPGVTAALLQHFGEAGDDAPLREALLMLAPALIQCFAALDLWTMRAADASTMGEAGGYVDSCYMWRQDSALQRNRGAI